MLDNGEMLLPLPMILAAVLDVRSGKIPNWLTYPLAVFGLVLASTVTGWAGFAESFIGMAAGFLPLFLLYLCGGMGGGDVKLMAAVGAMTNASFVLNAMVTSILVGALIALLIVIWEGKLLNAIAYLGVTFCRIFWPPLVPVPLEASRNIPFGVAICAGVFLTVMAPSGSLLSATGAW